MTRPTQELFDTLNIASDTGLSPPVVGLSRPFYSQVDFSCEEPYYPSEETSKVWAVPVSLAATKGIDFSFFSSGYLDVSVHRVSHLCLCIQHKLIQESKDRRLFDNFPWLFAVFHALHRLLTPRHPPCALNNLTTNIQRSLHVVKNVHGQTRKRYLRCRCKPSSLHRSTLLPITWVDLHLEFVLLCLLVETPLQEKKTHKQQRSTLTGTTSKRLSFRSQCRCHLPLLLHCQRSKQQPPKQLLLCPGGQKPHPAHSCFRQEIIAANGTWFLATS